MKTSLHNFQVIGLGFFFEKSFLHLCFLQLFPAIFALDITSQLYFKSYVSESRFPGPEITTQFYPFSDQKATLIRFLFQCTFLEWCEALCFLSSGTAVLTDLYVSGGVTDTMAGNKALCYTKRPRLLYPRSGVSITASKTEITLPSRVIENIEDGVYGFQIDECYCTLEFHPYILIELSESRTITKIALRGQPNGQTHNKFVNMVVRVGNIDPIGTDFNALSYFGKHDTGFPGFNMDVIIENPAGVIGKYISIQEEPIVGLAIQVCAIEITGF